ncbi:heavy-metal-associated domain-containing protein [Myroides sp. LJL119]
MRIYKSVALALLAVATFASCKQDKEQITNQNQVENTSEQQSNEVADLQKATFQVQGMTCAMGCAKFIENKLTDLPGVQNAVVDFDTKTATVVFDQGQQNSESITNTVQKIANGIYTVEQMQVEQTSL